MFSNNKSIGVIGGMGPMATSRFFHELIYLANNKYGAVQDIEYPTIYLKSFGLDGFNEKGIKNPSLVKNNL